YEILGTHLEKTTGQIRELQTQGKITFKDLEDAFKTASDEGGKFFGALERQANTVTGVLNTMEGEIDNVFVAIGEKMAPAIKEFGRLITEVAAGIVKWAENIDNDFVAKIAAAFRATAEQLRNFRNFMIALDDVIAQTTDNMGYNFQRLRDRVTGLFS